jgi:hypothetical protein
VGKPHCAIEWKLFANWKFEERTGKEENQRDFGMKLRNRKSSEMMEIALLFIYLGVAAAHHRRKSVYIYVLIIIATSTRI